MKFRAVIFDLDGTLLDTLDDLADSTNAVLRHLGFPEHPVEKYKYFVGEGMERLCANVLPAEQCNGGSIKKCLRLMRAEYGRRWADKTRPYTGIPKLLNEIAARHIKTAVLSNKPDDLVRSTILKFLSAWKFDSVVGERKDMPRKPAADGALLISQELGISPKEFIYVGDTGIDMKTAVAAGMHPVGALWGFRTAEELIASGAARIIATPLELLDLI
jgi:phosphoglycolate phosphatase